MRRTFAGIVCSAACAAQAAQGYWVYENTRLRFSVEVPEVFEPQGEADGGEGQRFSSRDGEATARVHGSHAGPCTARAMIADPQGSTITYTFARGGASVVSGYWRDRIFYKKAIRKKYRCLMLDIEYPVRSRDLYDPVTVRMARSFGG